MHTATFLAILNPKHECLNLCIPPLSLRPSALNTSAKPFAAQTSENMPIPLQGFRTALRTLDMSSYCGLHWWHLRHMHARAFKARLQSLVPYNPKAFLCLLGFWGCCGAGAHRCTPKASRQRWSTERHRQSLHPPRTFAAPGPALPGPPSSAPGSLLCPDVEGTSGGTAGGSSGPSGSSGGSSCS